MAPVQQNGTVTQNGDATATLEGPISLLWAYQLRREHALLLTRVDSLAETVQNEDAAKQVNVMDLDLKTARNRIAGLQKLVDAQGLDLQAVLAKVASNDRALAEIQLQLAECETQQKLKNEELNAEQKSVVSVLFKSVANADRVYILDNPA
jgi:hypothetical protein